MREELLVRRRAAWPVLGRLLTAVVLNMLVVPALFLRYGVDRPGTAGITGPRREPEPVLEDVPRRLPRPRQRGLTVNGTRRVGEPANARRRCSSEQRRLRKYMQPAEDDRHSSSTRGF